MLRTFLTEDQNSKNTVIVDSRAETMAMNIGCWAPVHAFQGEKLDSDLLYLQKYLIDLSNEEDMGEKLVSDFKFFD
jgi:hypothetical protein